MAIGRYKEPHDARRHSNKAKHPFVIVDPEVFMSKKPESGHGFSDNPQKVHDAGGKGGSGKDLKVDRAEKARVGGQHSHGGTDRKSGRT